MAIHLLCLYTIKYLFIYQSGLSYTVSTEREYPRKTCLLQNSGYSKNLVGCNKLDLLRYENDQGRMAAQKQKCHAFELYGLVILFTTLVILVLWSHFQARLLDS